MFEKLGFCVSFFILFSLNFSLTGQISSDFEIIYISECPPGIINLVNKSTGFTSCNWVFGNGNSSESMLDTLNQVYPNSGEYTITLSVSNGAEEVVSSKTIRIFKEPIAGFTTNLTSGCIPMTVTFTQSAILGDAEITEYYWDFRNGVVIKDMKHTIVYNSTGEYDVLLRVTDANGCVNFVEKDNCVKSYPQPVADFAVSPSLGCSVPTNVNLTNLTSSQLKVDYEWDFDNGAGSTSKDTSAIFTELGIYEVQLKAFNDFGCLSTKTKQVRVEDSVVCSFNIYGPDGQQLTDGDTVCNGYYSFKNTTIPLDLAYWKINNSYVSSMDSIKQLLQTDGWNTIELVPNISASCVSGAVKRLFVNNIEADFMMSEIRCEFPLTVDFTNLSSGAESFNWSLAQGKASTIEHPQIVVEDIYIAGDYTGSYPVYYYPNTLTITNETGCVDSITINMEFVHPEARLTADAFQGCIPLEINFTDTSASALPVVSKTWMFNDGAISTRDTSYQKHIYTSSGDFMARLILENEMGCVDTSNIFNVYAGEKLIPDFGFTPSKACYKDTISFTDKTNNSNVIDYWSYSSTANVYSECEGVPNPNLVINARKTGWHNLSLSVDYNGCISDTTFENALYVRGPISYFSTDMDCKSPRMYSFIGQMDQASSHTWDFGDGTFDMISLSPMHNYPVSGDYKVKLSTVNDTTGCMHELEDIIHVREIMANLECDSVACVGELVKLNGSQSVDYINNCYQEGFFFNFGDSSAPRNTHLDTKYHMFMERGTYKQALVAKDINGCIDTAFKEIQVFQPDPMFTVDSSDGCVPELTVSFDNVSTDTTITHFVWDFDDGHTLPDSVSVEHVYNSLKEHFYNSKLTAYDTLGCSKTVDQEIKLFKPNAGFFSTDRSICLGARIEFDLAYSNPDSSFWSFDDGPFLKQDNQFTFNNTGTFTIGHRVYKGVCSDILVRKDYINVESASANIIASDTVAECYPQTILFEHVNEGDPVVSGKWDFDFKDYVSPGYSDTVYFSYSMPGVFYPALAVKTKNGCKDTAWLKITVKGPYAEYLISDKHPCKYDSVSFKMAIEKDVHEVLWDFGDGLASIERNPAYRYPFIDTFYTSLTISDINGCTPPAIYDTVFIKQVKSGFSFLQNDTSFCVFDLILPQNNTIGATGYSWKIDSVVRSGLFEPNNLSVSEEGIYKLYLEVSDEYNCTDTSYQEIIVYPLPELTAFATDTICRDIEEANLAVITDSSHSIFWAPDYFIDDVNSFTPVVRPEHTIQYVVTAIDSIGCINKDSVEVFVYQYPEISRIPFSDTTILLGQEVMLQVNSNYNSGFFWNTNDKKYQAFSDTLVAIPLENTIYTVEIEDLCFSNSVDFSVNVRKIYTIELPDVFTPNGDGINDRIFVMGGGIKELIDFKVYNRFGNLVHHSTDLDEGWDGYYNGKLQNADVYTYFVKVLTVNDEEADSFGSFNLIH